MSLVETCLESIDSSNDEANYEPSHYTYNDALYFANKLDSRIGYRFVKRTFDIAFSLSVIILFSWVYAITAIAIKIDDPSGKVIFVQNRVGENKKLFKMYKFRSMYADAEERLSSLTHLNEKDGPVFKIKDDPRITKVGKFIRKTSIDELPQFFNVLLGDMSIVGPRPALPKEVNQYTVYQNSRLLVKPGITCFWQATPNRDDVSFDDWVTMDIDYIRHCSVSTDVKLIVRTIGVVLTSQGN